MLDFTKLAGKILAIQLNSEAELKDGFTVEEIGYLQKESVKNKLISIGVKFDSLRLDKSSSSTSSKLDNTKPLEAEQSKSSGSSAQPKLNAVSSVDKDKAKKETLSKENFSLFIGIIFALCDLDEEEGDDVCFTKDQIEQIASFFQSKSKFNKYLKVSGFGKEQTFAKLKEILTIPFPAPGVSWNSVLWLRFLLENGFGVKKYLENASEVEKLLPKDAKRLFFTEVIEAQAKVKYKLTVEEISCSQTLELAKLCCKYNIKPEGFEVAKKIKPKDFDILPEVTIDGDDVGVPGFYFAKLPCGDLRGFVLGEITHNCQSVGENGEKCAIDGMTSKISGFYCIFKKISSNCDPVKDFPVAEGWSWLSTENNLVLDSWEAMDLWQTFGSKENTRDVSLKFLFYFAARLSLQKPSMKLFLGTGGGTADIPDIDKFLGFSGYQSFMSRSDFKGYKDSDIQYVVAVPLGLVLDPDELTKSNVGGVVRFYADKPSALQKKVFKRIESDSSLFNELNIAMQLLVKHFEVLAQGERGFLTSDPYSWKSIPQDIQNQYVIFKAVFHHCPGLFEKEINYFLSRCSKVITDIVINSKIGELAKYRQGNRLPSVDEHSRELELVNVFIEKIIADNLSQEALLLYGKYSDQLSSASKFKLIKAFNNIFEKCLSDGLSPLFRVGEAQYFEDIFYLTEDQQKQVFAKVATNESLVKSFCIAKQLLIKHFTELTLSERIFLARFQQSDVPNWPKNGDNFSVNYIVLLAILKQGRLKYLIENFNFFISNCNCPEIIREVIGSFSTVFRDLSKADLVNLLTNLTDKICNNLVKDEAVLLLQTCYEKLEGEHIKKLLNSFDDCIIFLWNKYQNDFKNKYFSGFSKEQVIRLAIAIPAICEDDKFRWYFSKYNIAEGILNSSLADVELTESNWKVYFKIFQISISQLQLGLRKYLFGKFIKFAKEFSAELMLLAKLDSEYHISQPSVSKMMLFWANGIEGDNKALKDKTPRNALEANIEDAQEYVKIVISFEQDKAFEFFNKQLSSKDDSKKEWNIIGCGYCCQFAMGGHKKSLTKALGCYLKVSSKNPGNLKCVEVLIAVTKFEILYNQLKDSIKFKSEDAPAFQEQIDDREYCQKQFAAIKQQVKLIKSEMTKEKLNGFIKLLNDTASAMQNKLQKLQRKSSIISIAIMSLQCSLKNYEEICKKIESKIETYSVSSTSSTLK